LQKFTFLATLCYTVQYFLPRCLFRGESMRGTCSSPCLYWNTKR